MQSSMRLGWLGIVTLVGAALVWFEGNASQRDNVGGLRAEPESMRVVFGKEEAVASTRLGVVNSLGNGKLFPLVSSRVLVFSARVPFGDNSIQFEGIDRENDNAEWHELITTTEQTSFKVRQVLGLGSETLIILGEAPGGAVIEKWTSSKPDGSVLAKIDPDLATSVQIVGAGYLLPSERKPLTFVRREVLRNPTYGTPITVAHGVGTSKVLVLYVLPGAPGAVECRMTDLNSGSSSLYATSTVFPQLAGKDWVCLRTLVSGEAAYIFTDIDYTGPAGPKCVLVDGDRNGTLDYVVDYSTFDEYDVSAYTDPDVVEEDFISYPGILP